MILNSAAYSEIEDHILRRIREQGVPGAAVAIIQGAEPLFVRGFGLADVGHQTPVTPDTVFQIASLTKQFTATLITMLAIEGKLSLDDSVAKWFPEGGPKWSMISVRHLMAHLSGISDEPLDALEDEKGFTEDEFVATIASAPLLWQPGTQWDYCNSGYVLLGALVGRIIGQPWYDAMQHRIFEPLGMSSAKVFDEVADPSRGVGYEVSDGRIRPQEWLHPSFNSTADGGLMMNVQDFVAWSGALGSDVLLPQSEMQRLWEPVRYRDGRIAGTPDYRFGLGWMLPAVDGLPRLAQHKGAWQGFASFIGRLIDERLTVVVLTNMEDEPSNPARIGHDILKALMKAG